MIRVLMIRVCALWERLHSVNYDLLIVYIGTTVEQVRLDQALVYYCSYSYTNRTCHIHNNNNNKKSH